MRDPLIEQLEELYCRWATLRDARIASGNLRPSQREAASFADYMALLESLAPETRETWSSKREEIECRITIPRCQCGHPHALHVEGSCYAIIGCSTVCDCAMP